MAIIAAMGEDFIEVVQQNSPPPQAQLRLKVREGRFTVEGSFPAPGWLRVPPASAAS